MSHPPIAFPASSVQTYLVERDAGLLCRILGLYAARGMALLRVEYAPAEKDAMSLVVCSLNGPGEAAETTRVLQDKIGSLVGVLHVDGPGVADDDAADAVDVTPDGTRVRRAPVSGPV